ncbi:MAG TPA: hypothetical protein ENN36_07640 [Candidatus Bathyarchaeota archaeon]|nr:hypothetical protein [Candidatus Bathyarchaeota archaeon]
MAELADVIRSGTTRGLDFVNLEELRKRTGISPDSVLKFAVAEMLCNALDKDSTEISVNVYSERDFWVVSVVDNGSQKLSLNDLKLILNFANKASSKRGLLRVSRGYLGNALKCIFGYSYALAEAEGIPPPPATVESGKCKFTIRLKPDLVKELIETEIDTAERADNGTTVFSVKFAMQKRQIVEGIESLEDMVLATCMVNPTRQISYNILGKHGVYGSADNSKTIRQETSVLWYKQKEFETLFEDYRKAAPDTPLKDFIALFRGFTAKRVIREILQQLSVANRDSAVNGVVQFFPATVLRDVPKNTVQNIYAVMKGKSKPIAKRSIPAVLTVVGEENFEKLCEQNEWSHLKYDVKAATKLDCQAQCYWHDDNCRDITHTEYPYLIEVAVFNRQNDGKGLKVYQCVNFMASMENLFERIYNINYHLGRVGLTSDHPVTVIVHLVCPVLKWLNYGKSGLDE